MITLATGGTLKGKCGTATAVTYTISGDSVSTTDAFQILGQGQLPTSTGDLLTTTPVPASTIYLIKEIHFANVTASPVTGVTLYVNGTAAANQINGGFSIPANGSATLDGAGVLRIYGSDGVLLSTVGGAAGGDLTGSYPNPTLAAIGSAAGPIGSTTTSPSVTIDAKGRVTALTSNTISGVVPGGSASGDLTGTYPGPTIKTDVALAGNPTTTTQTANNNSTRIATTAYVDTGVGTRVPSTRTLTGTTPIRIAGVNTAVDLSADRTIDIIPATTSVAGSMSALDKQKLDNLWIDVTANTTALVSTANTGAQNITAINAILSAAPNGSTIYFPPGIYLFNAAWTFPNKMFSFLGRGSNRAGSPATAFTELRWNANVGASLLVLPGSGNGWYTTFANLTFTTTVDQTVGTVFDANGNVGTNFEDCAFQSSGGFFNDVLTYGGGAGSNSGNSATIDNCNIQGFKGNGVIVNAAGSSLVIDNTIIQGQWGTTAQAATSCIRAKWVGALQVIGCDILGGTNNILSDPTAASSEVCASLHCTNTYFDSSFGSCFKVSGTGATVRLKMDTCTFTTNTGGTGFSAVELAGSFVYSAGAQDIAFVNCNIYNTFGTTGTTNGVLITNAADVSFINVKVAGWTNGYNVTPMASNKTNLQIIGGTVGPSGGYGANSVGFLIGAGAYKGLQIRGNNAMNNTTNLTLGAVTVNTGEGAQFAITDNPGINPRGSVTTPAVAATTVATTNLTGFRIMALVKNGATTPSVISVNGVAVTAQLPVASGFYQIPLDPGGTITFTYTVIPTWLWVAN